MIINAFERQQEIKELYQDDAYTILHIIHEETFTVGYKKGPLDDFEGCNLQKPFGKPQRVFKRWQEISLVKTGHFLQKLVK